MSARARVSDRLRHALIVTVPEENLLGAANRMAWYRVGALPVYRDGRLLGIITERDLVTAVAHGVDAATAQVADHMTGAPATVGPDDDMEVAARRMAELGVRHLPVLDGDELVGVLSMRELLTPAPVA